MIELVASDMDGTLLSDHVAIHPDNIAAIQALAIQDIPFLVCTGRNLQMAQVALEPYNIICPKILLNGAIVYDVNDQILERSEISKDDALILLQKATELGLCAELITEEAVYISERQARLKVFKTDLLNEKPHLSSAQLEKEILDIDAKLMAIEVSSFDDILNDPNQHALKISLMDSAGPDVFGPIITYINEHLQSLIVSSSGRSNIEITHKEAQKGLALARYASRIGVKLDNCIAFGDNFNDVSMLEMVGHSFAMGNAEPEVKALARYQTVANIEAGVAKGLAQLISL
ncbi:Cof-type HAD-IIB family hydrolase [Streptococcus moroccensis]|uniref:Cof subfamily protein (Haloacid dehalogenase superfamily) n=1 Tax=Streptococcus moroccensis TaxID=1451356 RepID=A0ABT9YRU2_9STRE|nr:Cof-type HAD-IIB family hydrolase [Streptococcus moroccensis]MDQ0222721.1 Cof subfamily protein (haloacid dehalogenase superfamily) [Streptococcus moroccensis]